MYLFETEQGIMVPPTSCKNMNKLLTSSLLNFNINKMFKKLI